MALWLLKQMTRAAAAIPFEEVLYMSNSAGQNGKGCFIKLMMCLLGSGGDGYFHTLEFSKHFLGRSKSGNNPEIAELPGKRFVAVNETSEITESKEMNVELVKQLAVGGDNPVTAMAKYRDPSLFSPQLLLAFFAQDPPVLPKRDGGLRSRLSYLFMPFVFVKNPRPGTNERKLDTEVKERIGELVPELLFWIPLLTQGLVETVKKSRVIVPRPPKVVDDTDAQYLGGALVKPPMEVALEYADEFLCEWTLDRTAVPHKVPASRGDICAHFTAWAQVQGHKCNAREALLHILGDCRAAAAGGVKGAAYKQTLPREWGVKDVAVFKSGFTEAGMMGRPGWQLLMQKTVTIKGWPSNAAVPA
jgi:hypothetical protein